MNDQTQPSDVRRWVAKIGVVTCMALAFGAPTAQTVSDDVVLAVKTALGSWVAAFNRGDATGRYFADDAVMVRGNGTFSGATVINDMEQRESKAGLRLTLVVERVEVLGPAAAIAVGRYTVAPPGAPDSLVPGVSMHTLQRVGDQWQVRGASFTRTPTPPPVAVALK